MTERELQLKAVALGRRVLRLALIAFCLLFQSFSLYAAAPQKDRLIVLTDIGADPDDTMSMVRLLLYADQIDIEGLIATTSYWKKSSVSPALIRQVVEAYGKVQPNLNKNEPDFPDADVLLQKVKSGIPKYGMEGVGKGKDSQGSDWIIKVLEENDDRPLWISVWGGVNTLAQALYKIEKTKTPAEAGKLIAKLRVYTISDQDDSGIWIRTNFPSLFYIVSPGDDYGSATWSAINTVVNGINNEKISNAWLAENIQQNHGPLGAAYPDVAASGTTDPDGDSLSFLWFNYPEAGSYKKSIKIESAENANSVWIKAPEVQKPETAHFILEVTDKGTPPLTRYKRVIVTILPNS